MKHVLLGLTLVCALLGACSDPAVQNYKGLESADWSIPYSLSLQGITFYPDGYGLLSFVTYYPVQFSDITWGNMAWATNSDGAIYGDLTWSFTPPSAPDATGTATLRIDYPYGDYEIYTLYNLRPPSGYRGDCYYEYFGYSGGQTYTYDGSWGLDPELNSTQGLVVVWTESINYSVAVYIDGVYQSTLYSTQCLVKKVPFGEHSIRYVYGTEDVTNPVTIGTDAFCFQYFY